MANVIYPKFLEKILNDALSGVVVKSALVDSGSYTYSAAHEFLSDVPTRISDSVAVTGKTFSDGQFDCSNPVYPAVAAGGPHEIVVFYIDTGGAGTSRIICFIDTATGLPVTPNGLDITVNLGAYLFAL